MVFTLFQYFHRTILTFFLLFLKNKACIILILTCITTLTLPKCSFITMQEPLLANVVIVGIWCDLGIFLRFGFKVKGVVQKQTSQEQMLS